MTGSRAEARTVLRPLIGGAAALLLIAGLLGAAGAQQPVGAPLRLGPPGAPPPPAASPESETIQRLPPLPARPADADPSALPRIPPLPAWPSRPIETRPPDARQTETRPADARPSTESVEIAPLATIDPDNLGTRAAAGDPFVPELWARTPRDVATVLLQRLPGALASPALRDLQRRLLIAQAKVPEGNPPAGAPRLIALRIAKLIEMGDPEAADALLRVVPAKIDDEPIMRVRVDHQFLAGKRDEACAEVTRQLARFTNVFWQQAQVACQAAAGQGGPAGLGAQLLREQGFDNAAFFNLVELAGGAKNLPLDKLGPLTPATVVLLRATKRDVPADTLAATAPGVLRALALAPEMPLPTRLAAAERAAAHGALTPETLGQIYLSLEAPPADIANAAALAKSDKSARARALLFRAVRNQTNPTTRTELMRAAFEASRAAGLYGAAAALYRPLIEEIPPTAELVWFAGEAARALLAAGANDLARRWYDLARARANVDGEANKLQAQLWALFHIAGADDTPFEPVRLLAWYDAQAARPPAALNERAVLVYGLFGALGERVPSSAWLPLAVNAADTTRPVPGTGVLLELGSASTDARFGEAIALTAMAIGPRDVGAAGTLACTGITAALRALGLPQAARRFALEAALAAGA
ncbi:MAG: hypothetical protein HY060_24685 [Proteobacteria bacterium]|nr:hypothetical protein [Pseudomonadota bacterium]